jgi:hypothetical protein
MRKPGDDYTDYSEYKAAPDHEFNAWVDSLPPGGTFHFVSAAEVKKRKSAEVVRVATLAKPAPVQLHLPLFTIPALTTAERAQAPRRGAADDIRGQELKQLPLFAPAVDTVQRAQLRAAEHGPSDDAFRDWLRSLPKCVTLHLRPIRGN